MTNASPLSSRSMRMPRVPRVTRHVVRHVLLGCRWTGPVPRVPRIAIRRPGDESSGCYISFLLPMLIADRLDYLDSMLFSIASMGEEGAW